MPPISPSSPVEAARAYLKPRAAMAAFTVAVEAREGGFVRLSASAPGVQSLVGYARERGAGWEVLAFGTGFDDAFFRTHRVPPGIRLR